MNVPDDRQPHPRLDELIVELDDARRDLLAAVAELPPHVRNQARRDDGWTAAQILEHLTLVEKGVGRLMGRLIREAQERGAREIRTDSLLNTLDHANVTMPVTPISAPEFLHPNEGLSIEESLSRLEATRARLHEMLHAARGIALDTVSAPHPALGPLDGYRWLLATALHERRHTYQLRQLAAGDRTA